MWSEYGPLATLTVCTERTIRQLLFTVRNSATVLDMTGAEGFILLSFSPEMQARLLLLKEFKPYPDRKLSNF